MMVACIACTSPEERPPNVVLILADDLGYGDFSSYHEDGLALPHLDKMAAEGMRLTDFYVAAASCSPSRAALLTGMYPQRVGLPGVLMPQSTTGLHPQEVTLAEMLSDYGYSTAIFGKWHLGHLDDHLPHNHGFDEYFGIPYSNDMTPDSTKNPNPPARRHPPLPLVDGQTVIEREPDQSQLTRRYTARAIRFMENNRDRPFLLYVPHTFPHVPLFTSEEFAGRSDRGIYGDVLAEIDWSVGEILSTIQRLDLDHSTVVIFTSDNGPWLIKGAHSGSALPLREGKGTTFEGGQRVPFLVRWPGTIAAGSVRTELVTALDMMPTIAAWTGAPLPENHQFDGVDASSLFAGEADYTPERDGFFFYSGHQLQAVRSGPWKLHVPHRFRSIDGARLASANHQGSYVQDSIGLSLFNLEADIGETTNLSVQHPEVVARLEALLEKARADLGDALTGHAGAGVRAAGE